jgi:IS30 family transposase
MPIYSRLTREQRYTIEAMSPNGSQQKEIAEAIGKHPSTVSRELRRLGRGRDYCFLGAQRDANRRRHGGECCDPGLLALAASKLREEQWSPEQISASIKREVHGELSHETIYRHVYHDKATGGDLHRHLRHRCKSYRKHGAERERRGRLKDQVMIDRRSWTSVRGSGIGRWTR